MMKVISNSIPDLEARRLTLTQNQVTITRKNGLGRNLPRHVEIDVSQEKFLIGKSRSVLFLPSKFRSREKAYTCH
jgi:hypothetical protein